MVSEAEIKRVMAVVIGISAISRAFAIPKNLADLDLAIWTERLFDLAANITLYGGAIIGVIMIFAYIIRFRQATER